MMSLKEYSYVYEDGVLVRSLEYDIEIGTNENITSRNLVNTIGYAYDSEGKLIKKHFGISGETDKTIYYENKDNAVIAKFSAGGKLITTHSKTDSFDRKEFEEVQLGTGCISRKFSYHIGEVTPEHVSNEKVKSQATTNLVSSIEYSGGRRISYEYDAEERITKVIDTVDGITEYTYDALGQLLTEKVGEVGAETATTTVNTMTYDNYGNILTKNGIAYTYGDGQWKDLLTGYADKSITYDAQGNPTSYLGHTLTWEKGRQLKTFDNISYEYNANGIRTAKTVGGVRHEYDLEGSRILREAWNGNVIVPLYDGEDQVCGMTYNGELFFFHKNLQGDIIAITDQTATVVARYAYDAWGKCMILSDTSGCEIATVNPFRYRGYYYDAETGLYYVSSRYYDPEIGRWLNSDTPEMVGLSIISRSISDANLFPYCFNAPTNDKDLTGYISANKIANMFSISAIFSMFMLMLCASYSKGMVAVGAYATKVVTPVAVKAFWWKPWLAAAIILAAVAIVVAAVAIMYSSWKKEIDKAKKKIPNKLMKNGKVDLSKFNNPNGPKGPKGGRGILGPLGWYILKDIDQHKGSVWKLFNKIGERIASLLSDGTIVGK